MGFANERIAVIGGGLGRIAFMNAALYAGLRNVQLYEQAPEFAQVGAGVNISRNALLILDKYGLRDRMMRVSSHNPVLYMEYRHYRTGEYMGQVNEFAEPTARLLHRAHLLEVMKEPIPASMINKGKCLVSIERCTDGSGGYILAFKDGTKAQSDIIVGCDGIKSLVRQHLGLKDNPIYSGQMVYRGFVEYDDLPPQTAEQLRKTTNFQGPRRHVLNLPIGNDESKTARVGVIGFMTEPLEGRTSESWLAKAPVDSLDEHVKDWTGDVRKIIAALRKESTDGLMLKQALYVREPLSKWYAIRPGEIDSGIILLGDSAHSTLPHQGRHMFPALLSPFLSSGARRSRNLYGYRVRLRTCYYPATVEDR